MNHADTLSLFPLDSRCTLLTNLVWDRDRNGVPCLSRQKLWVGFPAPVSASGLTAEFGAPVGRVRLETAEDEAGTRWRMLAETEMTADLFMKLTPLVRRGGLCGGLHSGVDWRHPVDGSAAGYEGLLAEQFHFLLAAITGYLGCELTLDGLTIDGPDTERIRNLRPNFARLASRSDTPLNTLETDNV